MGLVLNRELAPGTPQTHVLVVGVGAYPHLIKGSESKTRPAAITHGLGATHISLFVGNCLR